MSTNEGEKRKRKSWRYRFGEAAADLTFSEILVRALLWLIKLPFRLLARIFDGF